MVMENAEEGADQPAVVLSLNRVSASQPVTPGIVRPSKVSRKFIAKAREDATQVKTFNAYLRWAIFRKALQLSPGIWLVE